jgi:Cu2+-exporting ATPase
MSTETVTDPQPQTVPGLNRGGKPVCRHCGAALIDDRMRASGFCCAGCNYVYRLVHEQGLSGYYRIKDEITTPADAAVFQPRDYAWLEELQRAAENVSDAREEARRSAAAGGTGLADVSKGRDGRPTTAALAVPEITLDLQGISCAGCVWLIERVFQQQVGAREIWVNPQYGTMRLRWSRGEFSAVDFARKLQAFGYLAGPAGENTVDPESRGLVKRIGLCAALAMNVMLFSLPVYFGMRRDYEWAGLFGLLSLIFGTLSVLVGGTYFFGRAIRALRERSLHIDLPISLGIVGAYTGSLYGWLSGEERFVYFDFVSAFTLLMLVGRWAQVAAVERNRRRLLRHQPKPPQIRLAAGGTIPLEQLADGQAYLMGTGQTLPVESRLDGTEAAFSLASINGEAEPRLYRAGQRVPAGAVSLGRAEIRVTALQRWEDSLLAELLKPGERPAGRHRFLERIVRGYLIGILVVAAGAGVAWWLQTADPLRTWAVVTAVLVVSCPCAVALAFPLADEMATVALRRRGVFVREEDLWTRLARVRQVVFDKTGTLTLETPVLKNPEALAALDEKERSMLLRLVEDNPHPVSQCLFETLLAGGAAKSGQPVEGIRASGEVHETVGHGMEIGGWSLGRPGWRTAVNENENDALQESPAVQDAVFACGGRALARFRFADTVRPDVRGELRALEKRGLSVAILSGDRSEKVAMLARELGLEAQQARGELTPAQKAAWLATHAPEDALMLGDGANDSLAFDHALCRGTPVIHRGVLERKADFYYLGRGIGGVRALFEVNAMRRRTQRGILGFSIAYNVLAVGLAVAGHMNPMVAAALMPINSLMTLAWVTLGMRAAFRR